MGKFFGSFLLAVSAKSEAMPRSTNWFGCFCHINCRRNISSRLSGRLTACSLSGRRDFDEY
jgi:hypothetical protein